MSRLAIKVVPWMGIAVLCLTLKSTYDGRRRAEGRAEIATAARAAVAESLANERRRVDTVYRADTVRLWRTIRESQTLIDTLLLSDTVTLTKRESVLVFVADSLVRQCSAVVHTCEQRVAVRDSLLSVATASADYWRRKSQPSLLTQLSTASKWLAVGFILGVTR
jgi:hypothetical protein